MWSVHFCWCWIPCIKQQNKRNTVSFCYKHSAALGGKQAKRHLLSGNFKAFCHCAQYGNTSPCEFSACRQEQRSHLKMHVALWKPSKFIASKDYRVASLWFAAASITILIVLIYDNFWLLNVKKTKQKRKKPTNLSCSQCSRMFRQEYIMEPFCLSFILRTKSNLNILRMCLFERG